jgi:CBS domain-containing protein
MMSVAAHVVPPPNRFGLEASSMKVSTRYRPVLVTVAADESLVDAAARMRWYAVGALPVYERHTLVGIVTERDLTAAVADGVDPARTLVRGLMTPAPATVAPGDELADAARTMVELGVRHLPVVDGDRLVGMLSIRDLVGLGLPAS